MSLSGNELFFKELDRKYQEEERKRQDLMNRDATIGQLAQQSRAENEARQKEEGAKAMDLGEIAAMGGQQAPVMGDENLQREAERGFMRKQAERKMEHEKWAAQEARDAQKKRDQDARDLAKYWFDVGLKREEGKNQLEREKVKGAGRGGGGKEKSAKLNMILSNLEHRVSKLKPRYDDDPVSQEYTDASKAEDRVREAIFMLETGQISEDQAYKMVYGKEQEQETPPTPPLDGQASAMGMSQFGKVPESQMSDILKKMEL